MNFKILFFSFLITLASYESHAQSDCNNLPKAFKSYNDAVSKVTSAKFSFTDVISGNFSSWIDKANYYSCDKATGYLILEASDTQYIHKNVPISIWKSLKGAKSKGSYYSKYIRGRYALQLHN